MMDIIIARARDCTACLPQQLSHQHQGGGAPGVYIGAQAPVGWYQLTSLCGRCGPAGVEQPAPVARVCACVFVCNCISLCV
jgi:hypothetical protein